MNRLKSWRLFHLLVIGFAVTLIVMVVAAGWLARSQEQDYLNQHRYEQMKRVYSAIASTSLEAVITEDRAVLRDIINRVVELQPSILSVEITNEEGHALVEWTRSGLLRHQQMASFAHDFVYQGEHFGSIKFVWSTQPGIDATDKHVAELQFFLTLLLITMAVLMILWIYWLVVKPISKASDYLEELQRGKTQSPLKISFPLELTRLAEAVNMLGNLLFTQQQREQELERRIEQRTSELKYRAQRDSLTGLYNRAEFDERLKKLLAEAKARNSTHALLYIDLDQFKLVNDTSGHIAGDKLLKQLSETLQLHIRQGDCLARMGGDEFTLLASGCTLDGALRIANKILESIRAFRFTWEGHVFDLGASIGIAAITSDSKAPEEILSHADIACYMAKDLGRDRIHVFHEHDDELRSRKEEMLQATGISKAIEENRLVLYFQDIAPVAPAQSGGRHFEILVRMQGNDGAIIPPGVFLPAAERFNLMASIDRFVIRETLRFLSQSHINVDQVSLCSINISGQSFCSDDFLEFLTDTISDLSFPSDKLCFEITETVAISNIAKVKTVMTTLKTMGCKFALDDFGSGMSSFAYLKHLPVDYLKIDGLFVKNMTVDPVDHIMVTSINEVGHALGIKTIAEFVEDHTILSELQSLGVDFAQGYSIAKPRPLSQLYLDPIALKK